MSISFIVTLYFVIALASRGPLTLSQEDAPACPPNVSFGPAISTELKNSKIVKLLASMTHWIATITLRNSGGESQIARSCG